MQQQRRILITGASGFLGFHLIQEALKENYEVYAAVRKTSNVSHLDTSKIHLVEPKWTDEKALHELLASLKITHIVHAAGATKAKTQEDYNFVNAIYTEKLAKAAAAAQIQHFLFISSLAAVGPSENGELLTESSIVKPITYYGKSKLLAENLLAAIPDLPYTILRPTAIYGPWEKDLFLLLQLINKGWEIYISRMPQILSFVHGNDVALVSIQLLSLPAQRTVYHISDGINYNRYDFASIAKKSLRKKTFKLHVPMPLVKAIAWSMDAVYKNGKGIPALNPDKLKELTAPNWGCSIQKIQTQTGFQPQFDLEKGLSHTIEWYVNNKWL